jgi:hypothetical protein
MSSKSYKILAERWFEILSYNKKNTFVDVPLNIYEIDKVPVNISVRLSKVKVCIIELLIRVRLYPSDRENTYLFLQAHPNILENSEWTVEVLVKGIEKIYKLIQGLRYDKRISKFVSVEELLHLSNEMDVFQNDNVKYVTTVCGVCNDVTNYVNKCTHVICFVCWSKGYRCPVCGDLAN